MLYSIRSAAYAFAKRGRIAIAVSLAATAIRLQASAAPKRKAGSLPMSCASDLEDADDDLDAALRECLGEAAEIAAARQSPETVSGEKIQLKAGMEAVHVDFGPGEILAVRKGQIEYRWKPFSWV